MLTVHRDISVQYKNHHDPANSQSTQMHNIYKLLCIKSSAADDEQ